MENVMKLEKILSEMADKANVTVSIFYNDFFSENMKVKSDDIEIVDNSLQINSGYMECSINLEDAVIDIEGDNKFVEFVDISYNNMIISLGWF